MSRSYNEGDDWDYSRQGLWDGAVKRATYSKRGQAVLRELEQALLALPEKKLIDGFLCDGNGVCAVGAIAAYRKVQGGLSWEQAFVAMDESSHYDPADDDDRPSIDDTAYFATAKLKMAMSLAWDIAWTNDHRYDASPELRYEGMLRWVRARIKQEEVAV